MRTLQFRLLAAAIGLACLTSCRPGSSASSDQPITHAAKPNGDGLFISISMDDPQVINKFAHLAATTGVRTFYNYSAIDGPRADAREFYDTIGQHGLHVVVGLHHGYDLYQPANDQMRTHPYASEYGDGSNEGYVRDFVGLVDASPGVAGYFITDDEQPEPGDQQAFETWYPVLQARYQLLKQLTTKPIYAIIRAGDGVDLQYLKTMKSICDILMINDYPLAYGRGIDSITQTTAWLKETVGSTGVVILQADAAGGKVTPTLEQMQTMRQSASGQQVAWYSSVVLDDKATDSDLEKINQSIP